MMTLIIYDVISVTYETIRAKNEIRFLMPSRNEGERHGQKAQNQSKRKVRNHA